MPAGPTRRGERVEVTAVLKNILDNYPSGTAILRETLQNSDDARAREQVSTNPNTSLSQSQRKTPQRFILDSRTFSTTKLFDPALKDCQGPSVIAVNDGVFSDKDWDAIYTILRSSKSQDET